MVAHPFSGRRPVSRLAVSDDRCLMCPAWPLVVLWKVSEMGIAETRLHLCGSHATRAEEDLLAEGWLVIFDRRQSLADAERS